ncbi:uncharacterized protein LOC135804879 [Sycon ciliatum]|uniref:uncharacterized protein LOC135804879 n=1 Tax=Sycon ciliatum TaxID=27933 RepID=UPI0031F70AF7
MTGVCTADTYNLKLLPSVVRQSDRYSLVDIHSDCRNHVMHVREALPRGLARNIFVFKFGAAVLWDLPDIDTTADVLALTNDLLRPIERGSSYHESDIAEDVEQMDYIVSAASNKTFVRGESLVLGVGMKQIPGADTGEWVDDQVAVSHALAKSVRLSTVEGQLQSYVHECQELLMKPKRPSNKREAWLRILDVTSLDTKANHPPVNMDDFYWERREQDDLHGHVLGVFDYNRRIAEFNQQLACSVLVPLPVPVPTRTAEVYKDWDTGDLDSKLQGQPYDPA